MQSATLGEFDTRLRLLDSFFRQLTAEADADLFSPDDACVSVFWVHHLGLIGYQTCAPPNGQRAVPLCESVLWAAEPVRVHGLIICSLTDGVRVRDAIALGRSPIERELRDQVKLHRWDDTNYYALKIAVTKAQSMLARFARAYAVRDTKSFLSFVLMQTCCAGCAEPAILRCDGTGRCRDADTTRVAERVGSCCARTGCGSGGGGSGRRSRASAGGSQGSDGPCRDP
jgi:hypothetical protein